MGRNAVITDTTKKHLTKAQRAIRNRAESEWRNGKLSDFEPASLNDEGMIAFDIIANAIPADKLATVDGYTIETAANALAKMAECNRMLETDGLVITRLTNAGESQAPHPAVQIYARYAEIAKRYLVELGCTPSARSKIAVAVSDAITRPKGIRELLEDPDD